MDKINIEVAGINLIKEIGLIEGLTIANTKESELRIINGKMSWQKKRK